MKEAHKDIVVAEPLALRYRIAGRDVRVPATAVLDSERIVISGGRSVQQVCGLLANPLAELVIDKPQEQMSISAAIYCLLTESTSAGMQFYLEGRNIPWKPVETRKESYAISDDEMRNAENEDVLTRLGATLTLGMAHHPLDSPPALLPTASATTVPAQSQLDRLPPIESVVIRPVGRSNSWSPVKESRTVIHHINKYVPSQIYGWVLFTIRLDKVEDESTLTSSPFHFFNTKRSFWACVGAFVAWRCCRQPQFVLI